MEKIKTIIGTLLLLSGGLLIAGTANALELSAEMYSDLEYRDNVRLGSSESEHDVVQTLGVDVGFREERKNFQTSANFRLEHEHFYNDTFDDQTSLTTGFGLLNFDLVESFLNWETSFTRSETLIDAAAVDTPDNREYRNILRTGPAINYKLSRASSLDFSAQFVDVEHSNDEVSDTDRVRGNIGYNYQYNRVTSFAISSSYESLIEGDGTEEYERFVGVVSLNRYFARGDINIRLGRTRFVPEFSEERESRYVNVSLRRTGVWGGALSLQYRDDISDTSIGFEDDETGVYTEQQRLLGISVNDVVEQKRLTLAYRRPIGRVGLDVEMYLRDQDYDLQLEDERSHGVLVRLNQQVYSGLQVGYQYDYAYNKYFDRPDIDDDLISEYQVDAEYNFSKEISLNSFVQYETRSNDDFDDREYENFSLGFGVSWQFL